MYCKYTLEQHLESLEKFYKYINSYTHIDFYHKVIVSNHITKRIRRIKNYLGIDYVVPKVSISDRFRENYRFIKDE